MRLHRFAPLWFALFGWFFIVTPPSGYGPQFAVGPYANHADCDDTLGSALYHHPFECHLTGNPNDCIILGNGFAYPAGYPFPVPPDLQIVNAQGCVQVSGSPRYRQGWYFLFYTPGGSGLEHCRDFPDDKQLAKLALGDLVGDYLNTACPGWPCFSVGFDTACD
jgi:hypothetical protein